MRKKPSDATILHFCRQFKDVWWRKRYCLLRRNDKYQVWPGQEMKTGAKSSRARKLIYTAVLPSFYPSYHLKSVPNCQGQLSNLLLPKLPLGICTQFSKFQKLTKGILRHIPVQGPGPAVFEISIYKQITKSKLGCKIPLLPNPTAITWLNRCSLLSS